jgi:hypothetical protein
MCTMLLQARTMEMMYSLISKALNEQGLLGQYHPRDYLTFVTLGNRCAFHSRRTKMETLHWFKYSGLSSM